MNSVNNHIYSMTRDTSVHDSQQPVVCQHSRWSVVDGISSLLPTKRLFQITRVDRKHSESEDGVNEAEQSSLNWNDILSVSDSEVDQMSGSEKDRSSTLAECCLPLANILSKEIKHSPAAVQSRFRIVKIESKGLFKRGRWTCRDFADPPEAKASDSTEKESSGSINATEPVFLVQGAGGGSVSSQLIFYSEGHPVLESDAGKLLIGEITSSISKTETGSSLLNVHQQSTDGSSDHCMSGDSGLKSVDFANSDVASEGTIGTVLNERYHNFDKVLWSDGRDEFGPPSLLSLVVDDNSDSHTAGGGTLSEIDIKIEQAMDLVKAHLMLAVRAEVEELKEQISQLAMKNRQLEYENKILRGAADPDLLSSLDNAIVDSAEYDNS